jgi:hypothetical protein
MSKDKFLNPNKSSSRQVLLRACRGGLSLGPQGALDRFSSESGISFTFYSYSRSCKNPLKKLKTLELARRFSSN